MLILLITLFCLKKLHTFLKRRSSTKMLVGIVALTGVCCPTMGFAQYYVVGQDPPSVKWRQMETENLLLIYPDYYEMQMQSFRNYCDTFAFFNRQEMDMPITTKANNIVATLINFFIASYYFNWFSISNIICRACSYIVCFFAELSPGAKRAKSTSPRVFNIFSTIAVSTFLVIKQLCTLSVDR